MFFEPAVKFISALLSLLMMVFTAIPNIITENMEARTENIQQQLDRIAELTELYASDDFVAVDESSLAGFDVEKAYEDGVKFNEVAYIATHNSYQLPSVPTIQKFFDNLEALTFGGVSGEKPEFCSDTLTEQLNLGIRSVELDIQTVVDGDEVSFVCSHSPLLDMTSTCYNFELALEEIRMWSDANPRHLPITIIIEPKEFFLLEYGMRFFNLEYANVLDNLVSEVFGDKLITPSEMMGEYDSFREMREADDWMTLEECAGRVAVFFHDTDFVTEKYIAQDETIKTRSMFPMLRYDDRDKSYASVLIVNKPDEIEKYSQELVYDKNLIVRTMVDSYGSYNEDDRRKTLESGAQILSTDYPKKADMTGVEYYVDFGNGTARIIK